MVSTSLFLTLANELLRGSPSLLHVTLGRGLPWCVACTVVEKKAATEATEKKVSHLERDHNVDCVSDSLDEGLAEVSGQPDLGSFFQQKKKEGKQKLN